MELIYPRSEVKQENVCLVDRSIEMAGTPSEVWPWLAQMGNGRAGWYSYDWLDNLGRPSFHFIDPTLVQIVQQQKIPFAVLTEVEVDRALTFQFGTWASMTYCLEEFAPQRTRLWGRARFKSKGWFVNSFLIRGHLFMLKKQFNEIKKRVENR